LNGQFCCQRKELCEKIKEIFPEQDLVIKA
jgi:hypothetical protein